MIVKSSWTFVWCSNSHSSPAWSQVSRLFWENWPDGYSTQASRSLQQTIQRGKLILRTKIIFKWTPGNNVSRKWLLYLALITLTRETVCCLDCPAALQPQLMFAPAEQQSEAGKLLRRHSNIWWCCIPSVSMTVDMTDALDHPHKKMFPTVVTVP